MSTTRACPVLTTARLTLTAHTLENFAEVRALWQDPEVLRFIGQRSSDQECWTRLLRYAGHWALLGYGGWQVRESATGRFVGEVGLHDFHRDLTPSLAGAPEAGWVLATWAHGQGFATEACVAVMDWSDTVLRAGRTVAMIDPGNAASLGVAAKMGFKPFVETVYREDPVVLLERFAPVARGVSV